jgi:hypothetical protein
MGEECRSKKGSHPLCFKFDLKEKCVAVCDKTNLNGTTYLSYILRQVSGCTVVNYV